MDTRRTPSLVTLSTLLIAALLMTASPLSAQELADEERIKWERQIEYISSLITREPSVPMHYMRMAQAYARLGSEQRVLQYTEAAVNRGGDPLAADILVGDFFSNQGKHPEALRRYMKVLETSPEQAHVLTQVWLIVQAARGQSVRLPVSLGELRRMLNGQGFYVADGAATGGRDAKPRIDDGNRRMQQGDFNGAVRAYQEAAAIDPWNPNIYRGLGVAFARRSEFKRAVGAYHLYIALAPPDTREVPKVREIIFDFYKKK